MDGSGEGPREPWEQAAELLWAWAHRDGLGLQLQRGWSSCPCSQGGGGGHRGRSPGPPTPPPPQREFRQLPSRLADALGLLNGFPSNALKTTVTASPCAPRCAQGGGGVRARAQTLPVLCPDCRAVCRVRRWCPRCGVRPSRLFLCGPSGLVCRGVSPQFFRAIAVCRCGVRVSLGGGEPRVFRCRHLGPEAWFIPL